MGKLDYLKMLNCCSKNKPAKLLKYAKYLEKWAKSYCDKYAMTGFCLGLSGGIDSALTLAMLCHLKNVKVLGVFINIESSQEDIDCVNKLKDKFIFDFLSIDLTPIYLSLVKQLQLQHSFNAKINLKVRLRTITLYALANKYNLLVCGTNNADERLVGYYTKNGDNACDINLIYWLIKNQIYFLAKQYTIPDQIINRQPTGGLYKNQLDEKDIGITYEEIDKYLCFINIDPQQECKIHNKFIINKHKMSSPAIPKKFMTLRKK